MNYQIRKVGVAALAMFGLLFLNLNWIQVIRAENIAGHDRNLRVLLKEHSVERGAIISDDNQTIALSEQTPNEELKFLRKYPTQGLFAPVTGYYSVVFGRSGLERTHNRDLTGESGVLTMQDLGDRLLGRGRKGDTIKISIDSRVQKAAAEALGGNRGAVVAMDPISGQILALVTSPTFDPNAISQHSSQGVREAWDRLQNDPAKPMLNRATSETYPPGSTFKILTAAAALEHGKGVETAYPATREYVAPQTNRPIGNFGGGTCGGDMVNAMRVSCNTYFARLGAELSQEDFDETVSGFGFGSVPPLDIRSVASRIPSEEQLRSPAFRAQSAIGQFNVAATPLQMALTASAIANRGDVPIPIVVKEIRDARGVLVEQTRPGVWRRAVSDATAATLTDLMAGVVKSGTGRGAALPGVDVAGKTGTAQTAEGAPPHAWFVAFAPAGTPRVAVVVLVENGGNLGDEATGGRVAAPIAKKVLESHREVYAW